MLRLANSRLITYKTKNQYHYVTTSNPLCSGEAPDGSYGIKQLEWTADKSQLEHARPYDVLLFSGDVLQKGCSGYFFYGVIRLERYELNQ
jgi:hypothetical protein